MLPWLVDSPTFAPGDSGHDRSCQRYQHVVGDDLRQVFAAERRSDAFIARQGSNCTASGRAIVIAVG